ncbi:MAG: hypothetical protein KJ709_07285 [Nanoarchaeota archaeon]|nr:hypothetical protein [Nanoarchaeota archaeon]
MIENNIIYGNQETEYIDPINELKRDIQNELKEMELSEKRLINLGSFVLGLIGLSGLDIIGKNQGTIQDYIGCALAISPFFSIPIFRAAIQENPGRFYRLVEESYSSNPGEMMIRHV